jgi:hypothetical protein
MTEGDLRRDLGRIEGQLEGIRTELARLAKLALAQERRMAELERWQARVAGVAGLAGLIMGAIGGQTITVLLGA